ncbi:MAG: Asp23/Gls24 family envelope stress response protein [Thermaerobacterales bacterium]
MEVVALIGAAGTGKSHRATIIAHELEVTAIIDDGLLIQGSRILAGASAKREATKVGAVRRAIFFDAAHRAEVQSAIAGLDTGRLLVLGTSRDMVHRICDNLQLPRPERFILIEEVATPEEIRQAKRTRRQQGKHVIPAPTFEVKRSFSGHLIDPLRFLYRSRRRDGEDLMIEKSMVRPTFSSLGRFLISENVLRAIAERAAGEIEGIGGTVRTRMITQSDGLRVDMDLAVQLGNSIPEVLRRVQRRVARMLEHMTALNILSVNVTARKLVTGERSVERSGVEPEGL